MFSVACQCLYNRLRPDSRAIEKTSQSINFLKSCPMSRQSLDFSKSHDVHKSMYNVQHAYSGQYKNETVMVMWNQWSDGIAVEVWILIHCKS